MSIKHTMGLPVRCNLSVGGLKCNLGILRQLWGSKAVDL